MGGMGSGRGEGYWGPKPGGGGGSIGGHAGDKRKYPGSDDVWKPNDTAGKVGKQPKLPKSPSTKAPAKVAGATTDGSPWHPPLRRVTVARAAIDAMRHACDAELPEGLLDEAEIHKISSVPDLTYLDAPAEEQGGELKAAPARVMWAPPLPRDGGPHGHVRRSLPVFRYRQALIDAFQNNPVTIVEGETGSGKTTQVAQYLLEHAAETGQPVNIICTQPRRISAIGVADRVAAERGERVGQGAIGYAIRGESRICDNTRLLFCTTGVLLRRLERDPTLKGVTHVLVDEVHERTVEGDFLLMALKEMLHRGDGDADAGPDRSKRSNKSKKSKKSRLGPDGGDDGSDTDGDSGKSGDEKDAAAPSKTTVKLGLMSATMDGDVLARYFDDAPRVSFPGRAFPVATLHLEDAIAVTKHWVDRQAEWAYGSFAHQRKAGKAASKDESLRPPPENEWFSRLSRSARNQTRARAACRALAQLDTDVVNRQLIVELVQWFVGQAGGDVDRALQILPGSRDDRWDPGMADKDEARGDMDTAAILVFLPGTKEIDDLREALVNVAGRTAGGNFVLDPNWILPLHGSLPPDDQRKVFERPPRGVMKVVLSTNVAETSITIDDVVCVIDTGRVKEERYDAERLMSSLDDVAVSAAAAKQRRGRAGRVRPGIAFHLFTSDSLERMNRYTDPEVRRVGLQQLVMRVKALNLEGNAEAVCSRLPEPPQPAAVHNAVEDLRCIGALAAADEHLTPLGKLLAQLPTDARLGKLVVYGCALGLADEALTLASLLGSRSPFLMPAEARETADESKKRFGTPPQSDVLGALAAYNEFDSMPGEARFAFARERFLSIKTLQQIANNKRQLLENLSTLGVVPRGLRANHTEWVGRKNDGTDGVRLVLGQTPTAVALSAQMDEHTGPEEGAVEAGRGSVPTGLLAALLCAGLYPQLAYLYAPPTKKGAASSSAVKLHVRPADRSLSEPDSATVHPSSVNSPLDGSQWRSCYVAFHERVKTTKVYVRDSTPVPPLAMMLLAGGELQREHGAGKDGQQLYETGGDGNDDILALDDFYRLHVPRGACDLILKLRERIQALVRRLVNNSGEIKGKKQWNPRNNDPTPAPPWTGDLEGETIVRDLVDTLSHISKWEDVKVAPELSAQEKKKLEARRRHEAKLAEQRRLKAARQAAHNNRRGRGGSSRSYGGGGGGGRNRGGRGGGGGRGHNRGNQNWNSMQKGGGAKRPHGGGGARGGPNKRHKKF